MKPEIYDSVFGRLRIHPYDAFAYRGSVIFPPDEPIVVHFGWDKIVDNGVKDEDVIATLGKAHGVYAAFQEREPVLRQAIAERAYEGDWSAPEGRTRQTFTLKEFMSNMKLVSISFHDHQIFSVVYDYGELFGGFMADDYVDENFDLDK